MCYYVRTGPTHGVTRYTENSSFKIFEQQVGLSLSRELLPSHMPLIVDVIYKVCFISIVFGMISNRGPVAMRKILIVTIPY